LRCFDKNERGSDYGAPLVSTLFEVEKKATWIFITVFNPYYSGARA
jgi:hypothetical protein